MVDCVKHEEHRSIDRLSDTNSFSSSILISNYYLEHIPSCNADVHWRFYKGLLVEIVITLELSQVFFNIKASIHCPCAIVIMGQILHAPSS